MAQKIKPGTGQTRNLKHLLYFLAGISKPRKN